MHNFVPYLFVSNWKNTKFSLCLCGLTNFLVTFQEKIFFCRMNRNNVKLKSPYLPIDQAVAQCRATITPGSINFATTLH